MAETRALLDQMIEDNQVALAEARDKLRLHLQTTKDVYDIERNPSREGSEIIETVCKKMNMTNATYMTNVNNCINLY